MICTTDRCGRLLGRCAAVNYRMAETLASSYCCRFRPCRGTAVSEAKEVGRPHRGSCFDSLVVVGFFLKIVVSLGYAGGWRWFVFLFVYCNFFLLLIEMVEVSTISFTCNDSSTSWCKARPMNGVFGWGCHCRQQRMHGLCFVFVVEREYTGRLPDEIMCDTYKYC